MTIILAKYLAKDMRAISRYKRIHDDLVESSNSGYPRSKASRKLK